jgi:carboxylesterase
MARLHPAPDPAAPASPSADPAPFFFRGGSTGCLLIHGFTGSPAEMRGMGEHLAQCGQSVSGPLLAGHGLTVKDLAGTKWQDWYASVEAAYEELASDCEDVFVAGLALGSLLSVHLGTHRPVAGVILLSPATWLRDWRMMLLPIARRFVKYVPNEANDRRHSDLKDPEAHRRIWCYDMYPVEAAHQLQVVQRVVRAELGELQAPALIVFSTQDRSIGFKAGPETYKRIAARDKRLLVLRNSGHVVTVDSERERVFEATYQWMMQRVLPRP